MAQKNRTISLFLILLSLVVLATACGASNDPETWAEAEADGNLRQNFIRACTEANASGGGDVEFTAAQAGRYCECTFTKVVEYFGAEIQSDNTLTDVAEVVVGRDFAAFSQLESDLRSDPEKIPADVEAMLKQCASTVAG